MSDKLKRFIKSEIADRSKCTLLSEHEVKNIISMFFDVDSRDFKNLFAEVRKNTLL